MQIFRTSKGSVNWFEEIGELWRTKLKAITLLKGTFIPPERPLYILLIRIWIQNRSRVEFHISGNSPGVKILPRDGTSFCAPT